MFTIIVHLPALRELVLSYSQSERVGNDFETCTGTMQRALEIPEILRLVFNMNLSGPDLVTCARVCRLWGIWALDLLWGTRPVPLQNVLQILAPVTERIGIVEGALYDEKGTYLEIGRINEEGWRRFLAISNKITIVTIDCEIGLTGLQRIEHAKELFNGAPFGHLRTLRVKFDNRKSYDRRKAISLVTVPSLTSVL
ncbi:hypothetical protein FRC00_011647, partial [Tulasnella sp. 408]